MRIQDFTAADVTRIVMQFSERTLPKAEWNHRAQYAAVLWYLRHSPDALVEQTMVQRIRRYNEATGGRNTDTGGYHETITIASVGAARAVLGRTSVAEPLHAIVNDLMRSPLGHPG